MLAEGRVMLSHPNITAICDAHHHRRSGLVWLAEMSAEAWLKESRSWQEIVGASIDAWTWLRSRAWCWRLAMKVYDGHGQSAFISLLREPGAPDFDAEHGRRLDAVFPYSRNTLCIEAQVDSNEERARLMSGMLEFFHDSKFLLDDSVLVVGLNNASARRWQVNRP